MLINHPMPFAKGTYVDGLRQFPVVSMEDAVRILVGRKKKNILVCIAPKRLPLSPAFIPRHQSIRRIK